MAWLWARFYKNHRNINEPEVGIAEEVVDDGDDAGGEESIHHVKRYKKAPAVT